MTAASDLIATYAPSPRMLECIRETMRQRWLRGEQIPKRDIDWLNMWKAFYAGQRVWQIAALEQLSMDELEEMQF